MKRHRRTSSLINCVSSGSLLAQAHAQKHMELDVPVRAHRDISHRVTPTPWMRISPEKFRDRAHGPRSTTMPVGICVAAGARLRVPECTKAQWGKNRLRRTTRASRRAAPDRFIAIHFSVVITTAQRSDWALIHQTTPKRSG